MMGEPVLVLGLGNPLCGDDGFGIAAVAELERGWRIPERVRVVDGGTQGIYLLPYVQACDRLLVFDAVDLGAPAGGVVTLADSEVPSFIAGGKTSAHQGGLSELLALAQLLGWTPSALALVGVQIERIGLGLAMSEAVAGSVGSAIERAIDILAEWDVTLEAA